MDEIRSQLLSRTPTTKPSNQQPLTPHHTKLTAPPTQTTTTETKAPLTQPNSTQVSQPSQSSQIQHVTQLLKHTAQITVNVSSTQALDNKSLQLLAKVNPTLSHSLNHGQTQTKPFNTQTHAAQNNTLYMVKLAQAGSQHTLLTTITPTAFKQGDQLQLQLNQQQQMVIKPSVASVRPAIAEGLKLALPQQQNISQLLGSIHHLQKLPAPLQHVLLNTSTANQLNTLSHFIKSQYSLTTANQVKTTLNNSGLMTEQKIQTQQSLHGDLRASLGALIKSLPQTLSTHTTHTTEYAPQKTIELAVTHLLTTFTTAPTNKKNSQDTLQQALGGLLQLLGIKPSQHATNDVKKIKEAIAQKLHQLANNSQEKIQLNQLRALESGHGNDSNTTKLAAFNTEIPLRFGDHVLPLQLSIKEMEEKKQEENNQQSDNKKITRRWQVFLSFDLPSHTSQHTDQLHTQLIVVNNTVSATLWADSPLLCQKAKQQLATLRNNLTAKGLEVEDLLCINGKPPQQTLSLDYNLIDITT